MTRIDLLREIGIDVETAVILDDELSRLPDRTQRVFMMRAQGYTQQEVAGFEEVSQQAISIHVKKIEVFISSL